MNRNQEKLLIATLAGLVIAAAAAFAVTPSFAAGYTVDLTARVSGVASWDVLNVRKWPASYSQKTGALEPEAVVWVERCIIIENASDWCRIERGELGGWVNSKYLTAIAPEDMGDF